LEILNKKYCRRPHSYEEWRTAAEAVLLACRELTADLQYGPRFGLPAVLALNLEPKVLPIRYREIWMIQQYHQRFILQLVSDADYYRYFFLVAD